MMLWSYQRDGFSPVEDCVEPQRSEYATTFPDAYERLWQLVGTDQIVWCVTDPSDWPVKSGYVEWKLDVPTNSFLRVVDTMIWNRILGQPNSPTARLRKKLHGEAWINTLLIPRNGMNTLMPRRNECAFRLATRGITYS